LTEAAAAPDVEVEGLRKAYGSVEAVAGVDFEVPAGSFFTLLGPSGSGKTTTLRLIAGFERPAGGRIRIAGAEITSLPPYARDVNTVFQDYALFPHMTVGENVEYGMRVAGAAKAERGKRRDEALEMVRLPGYGDRKPAELSGGQRQRVAIAASLVLDPKLLVADEPVSMLDVSVRAGILSLLDRLRKDGMGILMITHDLSTAAHFADRIAVMYLGRIVEEGPARQVVRNPQHPYTRALITVVPKRDPREQTTPQILTGETPNPIRVPSGCRFHPRCPIAEPRCSTIDPSLQRPRDAATPDHRAACIITAPGPSADEVGPGGRGAAA
jgi:oligopeptide/dipeptide ABC transporter ATP-binding protein